ncbi:Hypothetical protein KVN_LOCUS58 [uncultured virus]|nr:Hypothetical protein KVN_LOCUS58 [uncultured virus]
MDKDYKLLKYIDKINNKEFNQFYAKKIKKYFNQLGGNDIEQNNQIDKIIEEIVKNNYDFGYNSPEIKTKLLSSYQCSDDDTFEDFEIYQSDLKIGCFKIKPKLEQDLFVASLKGMMTDLFVKNLGTKLFEKFSLIIIQNMNFIVDDLIK